MFTRALFFPIGVSMDSLCVPRKTVCSTFHHSGIFSHPANGLDEKTLCHSPSLLEERPCSLRLHSVVCDSCVPPQPLLQSHTHCFFLASDRRKERGQLQPQQVRGHICIHTRLGHTAGTESLSQTAISLVLSFLMPWWQLLWVVEGHAGIFNGSGVELPKR